MVRLYQKKMKSIIKTSEIHDGLLKINRQRAAYYQKASDKIHELNWKSFFNGMIDDGRKNESEQTHEITKPNIDIVSDSIQRSKFYRLRMKVKTIIYNAYELD